MPTDIASVYIENMPSVRFQDNNFPEKYREVVYEFCDESLESLVKKHDSYSTPKNTRCAIDTSLMLDWKVPIATCLNYGDIISLYRYKSKLVVIDGTGRVRDKLAVEVDDNATLYDLKNMIKESLYKSMAMKYTMLTDLELFFKKQTITSKSDTSTRTVRECGIRHGDELAVTYQILHDIPRMLVFVKTLTGKTIRVFCEQDSSVLVLKEHIQDQEGIPPDQSRLVFNGSKLENTQTLMDCNIKYRSIIHLILRLRGGGGIFADMENVNMAFFN